MFSRRTYTGVFLAIFFGFLLWFNLTKPRIMIVHSYATDFPWVRDINVGINRILKDKPYLIRWHYLDTKRNPDKEFKVRASAAGVREIQKWRPDILILIDDNAQEMIGKHFLNDPSIKVIFTGVNAEGEKYGFDKATNATGVLERIPFQAVHEAFMLVNPKGRFYHVCDSSETSVYIQHELEDFKWDPLSLVETKLASTFEEWKKSVEEANESADFLLITHYHTIKAADGRVMRPKEVLDWTKSVTKVPMVGCWDFFVEDGGMLSISVSPYEQGEEAAKMAVDIIENKKDPKDMKWYRNVQFTISMRGNELKKFKVEIPRIFEAFARGVNHYFE